MNRQFNNANDRNLSRELGHLPPKRTTNLDHNASKSSLGTYPNEIKLIPLELRPILDQEDRRKEELRRRNNHDGSYLRSSSEHVQYHNNYKDSKIPRRQVVPKCPRNAHRDVCCNTSDLYRNILGPTADESILAGLQTVIDICGLADYYGSDSEDAIPKQFPYGTIIESYSLSKTKQIQPNHSNKNSVNDTGFDETYGTPPSSRNHSISSDYQTSSPGRSAHFETAQELSTEPETPHKSRSRTKHEKKQKPAKSPSKEKHLKNSKTHHPNATSTPSKKSALGDDFMPPNASPIRRPSITPPPSPTRQLSPRDVKHDPYMESVGEVPELHDLCSKSWCKIDECCGTSTDGVPCVRVTGPDGRHVCIKYKCESMASSLSAKCFPPVEIPPCDLRCKKCHIVETGVDPADIEATMSLLKLAGDCSCLANGSNISSPSRRRSWCRREKKDSKSVIIQDPKAARSYVFDPNFTCNPNYEPRHPKLPLDFRFRNIPPAVQPVIGVCNQGRCGAGSVVPGAPMSGDADGERLLEVRYALVRISVFNSYTTYEIMKSSKKKPKNVPDNVEGIFVTKR